MEERNIRKDRVHPPCRVNLPTQYAQFFLPLLRMLVRERPNTLVECLVHLLQTYVEFSGSKPCPRDRQLWKSFCSLPQSLRPHSRQYLKLGHGFSFYIPSIYCSLIINILRRNCILQRAIEGKIKGGTEVTGRRGRRRKKLLNDLKERRGYSHLKEEALDRTKWRARFGRGFGPVVRQTTKWTKELLAHCTL